MEINTILANAHLIKGIRAFFENDGFIDIITPPMVENPGMETHIHPFQVAHAKSATLSNLYLHTSPEFHMKELISRGFEKIFTLSYAFRDEPNSDNHRPQFLMLEWYRKNAHYTKIMDDCEGLFKFSLDYLNDKNISIDQSFKNYKFERFLKIL
jgi:lysyl-tRNA synthetase class 2